MTRIIFMGTPDYASSILEALIADPEIDVRAVYTQPDKPVGRKAVLTPPIVKTVAEAARIPVYQPEKLRAPEVVEKLRQIPCDLIVVAAYGQILPKAVIDYVPCVNLHASILPAYRGASPIQQSLLNNDPQTGVTAMWMNEGLDTGDIIKIETLSIAPDEMIDSLYARLTESAAQLTLDVAHTWDRQTAIGQDDDQASLCRKISKTDGLIAFDNAREIYNRYRAFTPWPGIYLESGLKLKVMSLENEDSSGESGKILSLDKESALIQCSKGALRIYRVQAPSKQETSVFDYANGKRLGSGNYLV